MLAFMTQYPWSTRVIPTSYLLPAQWPQPLNDELLLAMEESEYEEKIFGVLFVINPYWKPANFVLLLIDEIRKGNTNLIIIGKTRVENENEEFDNDADDDDADNAEESEGDEFEQETG